MSCAGMGIAAEPSLFCLRRRPLADQLYYLVQLDNPDLRQIMGQYSRMDGLDSHLDGTSALQSRIKSLTFVN